MKPKNFHINVSLFTDIIKKLVPIIVLHQPGKHGCQLQIIDIDDTEEEKESESEHRKQKQTAEKNKKAEKE